MRAQLLTSSILLALAAAIPAHAASSTSTPAIRVVPPDGIWCAVTNVSTKPLDVSVATVGENGSELNNSGVVTVAPGASVGNAASSPSITGFVYCRANGQPSKKVHVTTCLVTANTIVSGSGECLATTTSP
ncbi:MAG TPA: hypothetical protein VN634_20505 [Candidatus Limnocylindrales bacterium]|nr:hypothetical protein [Candidatus Limnocylindrales bacterium]